MPTRPKEAQQEAIVAGFANAVSQLGGLDRTDEELYRLGQTAALSISRPELWADAIGPLLTSAQVRESLGRVSREALSQRVSRGRVIALRDRRGRIRYPLLQFDADTQQPYPEIALLIALFEEQGLSSWDLVSFLAASQPDLGISPAAWLAEHQDPELLLAVARETAARLAR